MENLIAGSLGTVKNPYTGFGGGTIEGLPAFLTVLFRTLTIGAGIYALLNFIIAGYTFMSAGGDSQKIANAWAKIWQSIMGVVLIFGSFAIMAILGIILFGDASYLLRFRYFTPQ